MATYTLEAWVGAVAYDDLSAIAIGNTDPALPLNVKNRAETLLNVLSSSDGIDIVAKIGALSGTRAKDVAGEMLLAGDALRAAFSVAGGAIGADLKTAQDRITALDEQLVQTAAMLHTQTNELGDSVQRERASATRIQKLEQQLQEAEGKGKGKAGAADDIEKLEKQARELQSQLADANNQKLAIQKELDTQSQTLRDLRATHTTSLAEIEALKTQVEKLNKIVKSDVAEKLATEAQESTEKARRAAEETRAKEEKEAREKAEKAADKKRQDDEAATRQAEAEKLAADAAKTSEALQKATHDAQQLELQTLASMVVFDNVSASAGKNQRVAKASKKPFALAYLSELRNSTPLEEYIADEIASNKNAKTHPDQFFQPLAIVGVWKTSDAFNKAVTDAGLSTTNMIVTYSVMKELLEHFKEENVVIENATLEIDALRDLAQNPKPVLTQKGAFTKANVYPADPKDIPFRKNMYAFMKLLTPINENGSLALGLYSSAYQFVSEDPIVTSLMTLISDEQLQAFWAAKDASIEEWGDSEIPANTIPVANTLAESKTSHSGYAVAANADIAAPLSPGNRWAANPSIQAFLGDEGESSDSDDGDDDTPPVSLSHPIAAGVRSFFGMS